MARGRIRSFAGLVSGLPGFLGKPIGLEEARLAIRRQLADREANFLAMLCGGIYGHTNSPYVPLLREAQCELGDIERMVGRDGIEATLLELRRSGVYMSFEEFKGREPIARGGLDRIVSPQEFDNPIVRGGFAISSGGSTGRGTPVWLSLPYLAHRATSMLIGFDAHGVRGVPTASLREPLPAPSLSILLEDAHIGQVHERWFSPAVAGPPFSEWHYRSAHRVVGLAGGIVRVRIPRPEFLEIDRPLPLIEWAARRVKEQGTCMIRTSPGYGLRTCLAAEDLGVSLEGVVFVGAGEPLTPGKIAAVRRSGARWVTNYAVAEVGRPGIGCVHADDPTDVHFLAHAVGMIQYPRTIPAWGGSVDSFHFSSVFRSAPKILLNVETDDFGLVEHRSCGCPLETIGFGTHIRQIFSYSKLTGESVSLLGSDALRIIDQVLPEAFGGSPADYQFVEEEDDRGATRVTLVVSPRLDLPPDDAVIDVVLGGLGDTPAGASVRSIWRSAKTMRVRRAHPKVTGVGKLMPIVSTRNVPPIS